MALGGNMKRRKLIPENEEEKDVQKQEETNDSVEELAVGKEEIEREAEKKEVVEEEEQEPIRSVRIIVEPSRRKSVKKAKVFIEGKLDIVNAVYLTEKIKEVIAEYNVIDFRLRDITDIDLSSIQILYFMKELLENEEKTVSFQLEDLPIELKTLLVKTKYNKLLFKK